MPPETEEDLRPVVLAPTYNNARTLGNIIDRVVETGLPFLLVNDGSTDRTAIVLNEWAARHGDANVIVVTHEVNKGKAAALKTGFREASRLGFTHAITIDTDGQLDPEEIPRFLEAARAHPTALIVGYRDDTREDYPARSRLGRNLSNRAIRFESGARIEDSQCGFRVYPLGLVEAIKCRAERFGYEAEIITRAAWAGAEIVNVPVTCRYFQGDARVSHYRPWYDSVRGVALHARLILRRFSPWPHRRWAPARDAARDRGARE